MTMANDVILIVGMGRSGSSALARVLSLCGARLPDRLLAANAANPTGYWEPADALTLNDEFLGACGSSWYDTRLPEQILRQPGVQVGPFREHILTFLGSCSNAAKDRPLVIKEPRITALLPVWLDALAHADASVRIVIPVRHPEEVIASLAARDSLSREHAAQLWLKYNIVAEHDTRHIPRIFVSYTNLLRDWRSQIARVNRILSVPLIENDEVDRFLDLGQRHHVALASTDATDDVQHTYEIFEILDGASNDKLIEESELDIVMKRLGEPGEVATVPHAA